MNLGPSGCIDMIYPLYVCIWWVQILNFEIRIWLNCLDRIPVRSYFDMIINYLLDRQKEHSRQNHSYFCYSILFNYAIAEGV